MYLVEMEYECGCFKKSEYSSEKSFETQKDAYNYANILAELMNEEFCTKHLFTAQKTQSDGFVIRVVDNPNAYSKCADGDCSTDSSSADASMYDDSCSSGSCGCQ
ncbi:MAG: hypothetical protein ABFQ64_03200 [Campylobacterota bacterium]